VEVYNKWTTANYEMPSSVEPQQILRRDRTHRICLVLACSSFVIWLFSSYAISNLILSVARLLGKFPNR